MQFLDATRPVFPLKFISKKAMGTLCYPSCRCIRMRDAHLSVRMAEGRLSVGLPRFQSFTRIYTQDDLWNLMFLSKSIAQQWSHIWPTVVRTVLWFTCDVYCIHYSIGLDVCTLDLPNFIKGSNYPLPRLMWFCVIYLCRVTSTVLLSMIPCTFSIIDWNR